MSEPADLSALPTAFGKVAKTRSRRGGFLDKTVSFGTVNKLYNKVYRLEKDCAWTLPDCDKTFESDEWTVNSLQLLKNGLNFHKSQLNDYPIDEWSAHTRKRNLAGDVRWRLRTQINPEFLTQAWTKFYECVTKFEVIPKDDIKDNTFNSVHLCEAPGAFIASLNHFLKLNHKDLKWEWLASTLNPYYEGNSISNMICDDRFLFHTLERWHFGLDNTGNIMSWENSQAIVAKARQMGDILLVTADGSIDCTMNPAEQEQVVAPLHYCEVITALQILAKGGTFVCKFFTLCEHPAICILYILNVLFKEVSVFKPATSKEGNSEVYLVCLKYAGSDSFVDYIPAFRRGFGTEVFTTKAIFPFGDLPEQFLMKIDLCANYFNKLQCSAIDNNIFFYDKQSSGDDYSHLKSLKLAVAQEFISRCALEPIPLEDEILRGLTHNELKANLNPRNLHGSFTERTNFQYLSKMDKLKIFKIEIESSPIKWLYANSLEWVSLRGMRITLNLKYTRGKPVHKLKSSKFITTRVFKLFNDVKDLCGLLPDALNYSDNEELQEFIGIVKYINPETVTYLKFDSYDIFDNFDQSEKIYFDILYNKLRYLRKKDSVVIANMCLLSHFSVGILFLLTCKLFEKVGFCENGLIVLYNLTNQSKLGILDGVVKERMLCKSSENGDGNKVVESLLGILPVQLLETGTFYTTIIEYNNNLLKHMTQKYLDIYSKELIKSPAAKD